MSLKQMVVGRAMELAQRPLVARVLARPSVGRNVMRAWEARARLHAALAAARQRLVDQLALATREDVTRLQRMVQDLEAAVSALGVRARPADPAATTPSS